MKALRCLLIGTGLALTAAGAATSAANATPPTSARYHYNWNCRPMFRWVYDAGAKKLVPVLWAMQCLS